MVFNLKQQTWQKAMMAIAESPLPELFFSDETYLVVVDRDGLQV